LFGIGGGRVCEGIIITQVKAVFELLRVVAGEVEVETRGGAPSGPGKVSPVPPTKKKRSGKGGLSEKQIVWGRPAVGGGRVDGLNFLLTRFGRRGRKNVQERGVKREGGIVVSGRFYRISRRAYRLSQGLRKAGKPGGGREPVLKSKSTSIGWRRSHSGVTVGV